MRELMRQVRWLFVFRLITLVAAVFVAPSLIPLERADAPVLGLWLVGLIVAWTLPFWGRWARQERVLGLVTMLEAIAIAYLVNAYGGIESPFALLFLPVLAQAAALLPMIGYTLVASTAVTGYLLALLPDLDMRLLPLWWPVAAAGLLLLVAWLGVLGEGYRDERVRVEQAERRFHRLRRLVERLPSLGRDEAGWREFLRQVERGGGFRDGAIVVWEGPRASVIATDRQESWEGLIKRHGPLLRRQVLGEHRPEIFIEQRHGHPSRSIVCWPIGGVEGEAAAGALCLLADEVVTVPEAARRLRQWLPLAALGLAANRPRVAMHRAPVDWRVLMNVTLHKLHARLSKYLVLVHVAPGAIEADAVLLADAIAQVVEDALDRVPPHSQVRLDVRRVERGWSFQVRTATPARPAGEQSRTRLLAAQHVVAAHGGEWRAMAGKEGYQVGFVLPDPASPSPGAPGTPPPDDATG